MRAYVVNQDSVTWRMIDDEAVIVHAGTSEYFSLNQLGTWLWGLLEKPRTTADLISALGARYRLDGESLAADAEEFVAHLSVANFSALRRRVPTRGPVLGDIRCHSQTLASPRADATA